MTMEFSAEREDNSAKDVNITFDGKRHYESRLRKPKKFPGCFIKTVAFLIDNIVIAIACIALFPFSDVIGALSQHAWVPSYLIGAAYFVVLESSIFKGQSIGKMLFHLTVKSNRNKQVTPFAAIGRYVLITLPIYNIAISNSIVSFIGTTNTAIGGVIYLVIVGILLSGNTLFMIFHSQKRGLHDILTKSVVTTNEYVESEELEGFSLKPLLGGAVGLLLLTLCFGGLFKASKNQDFSDIQILNDKIKKLSNMSNINTNYRTFSFNGQQTSFAIEVNVVIPYDKFNDKNFTDSLSNKLYSLVKTANNNPKVDTIAVVYHAERYFGALPVYKTSRSPKKISEINL